jgi:hypothetical protein
MEKAFCVVWLPVLASRLAVFLCRRIRIGRRYENKFALYDIIKSRLTSKLFLCGGKGTRLKKNNSTSGRVGIPPNTALLLPELIHSVRKPERNARAI